MRALNHGHYCDVCGNYFDSSRYDAQYCGSTCRSKAHRAAKERTKTMQRAEEAITALGKYCGNDETREVMRKLERRIALMINEGELRAALRD